MSRKIGMDNICLRPTPRLAHTDYSMEYHESLVANAKPNLYDAWDFDFLWCTNDGPVNWSKAGRSTDMGHAVYAADGRDERQAKESPFESPEEVWAFDPMKEYGLPEFNALVQYYEADYQKRLARCPNQVCTGGYYKTVVSGAIQSFGWDMLLTAAADYEKFARVLERFGAYTLEYNKAQAQTSIEVFIQHDDMVWTEGAFMPPEFYRKVIFPIYRRLWAPLKKAGKKVLFCSDGKFDMFMDDVAAAGADGFIFEPCNDFASVVNRFGKTHCIVGSMMDCRTMTFGTWAQVKAEMDATLALAKQCPGFIWAVGNHIPANVPDEMCEQYIAYLRANWNR